jgi:hypothetical protein
MDVFTRSGKDLSTEYLAEDISAPLRTTCCCFLVIEAVFIVLMYISRYLSRDKKKGMWMVLLMTAGYLTCVGKITVALRKSCPLPALILHLPRTPVTH